MAILRVGPNQAYSTIQDAVDAANENDVILVYEGVYHEEVDVDVDYIEIIAYQGKVIMDGENTMDQAFTINAEGVEIRGFIIRNYQDYGIYVDDYAARIIQNKIYNIIDENDSEGYGIYIDDDAAVVYRNNIHKTTEDGIYVGGENNWIIANDVSETNRGISLHSDNNAVIANVVKDNVMGIYDYYDNNLILYNAVCNNETDGIHLYNDEYSPVIGNLVAHNGSNGIYMNDYDYAYIARNIIKANEGTGILFAEDADDNVVEDNKVFDNKGGIKIQLGNTGNLLLKNKAFDNKYYDIKAIDPDYYAIGNRCEDSDPEEICVCDHKDKCDDRKNKGKGDEWHDKEEWHDRD